MQRVPQDRLGNGFAKAVAAGVDPSMVIVSSTQMDEWRALANAKEAANDNANNTSARNQARKDLSQQHAASWTDTLDRRINEKMSARSRVEEEAERRRRIIDEETAALQAAELQQKRQDAISKLQVRDQRMIAAQSQLALQRAMDEREEQIKTTARLKEMRAQRNKELDDSVAAMARASEQRQLQRRVDARDERVRVKDEYMQSIEAHRESLRQAKAAAAEEGRRVTDDAAAYRRQQLEELAQRKEENYRSMKAAMAEHQLTPRSHAERHRLQVAQQNEEAALSPGEQRFVEYKTTQQATHNARQQHRFEARQFRIGDMTEKLAAAAQLSPRERCADAMSSGRSLNDAMHGGDSARGEHKRGLKGELRASLDHDVERAKARKQAQAHMQTQVQQRLHTQLAELEAADQEDRLVQRRTNERARAIQVLQAKEKKQQAEYEKRLDYEEGVVMKAGLEAYDRDMDALVRDTVQAQHPGPMNPTVLAKAMSPRRDLVLPA